MDTARGGRRLEFGVELGIELLLFLLPYGAEQMGLEPNFWLGLGCWILAAGILVRMVWIAPFWADRLHRIHKILLVILALTMVGLILLNPIRSAYHRYEAVTPKEAQKGRQKVPFAFTESLPDTVTVLLSNGVATRIAMTLKTAALEKERFTGLLDLNGDRPITAYVQDGVFYVDATIMDLSGHKVVQIKKNKVEVMPAGWDMNFSANAVEVVDANQHPIFQMIRRRANVIQIAGLFVGKGGTMFDARPAKTLFKYPSWEFRGQYAPKEPISQQDQTAAKRYSRMTNAELRSNVQQLCSKIRNLGREWDEAYFQNNKRAIAAMNSARSDEEKRAYGTKRVTENEHEYKLLEARFDREYRSEANLLAAELSRRVETPAEVLESERTAPPLLQAGVAAGANPWDDVCNYLETLARRLP